MNEWVSCVKWFVFIYIVFVANFLETDRNLIFWAQCFLQGFITIKFGVRNRGRSVLTETGKPTVLTAIFGNRKEPKPLFGQKWNPFKNRNRNWEPRVPETIVFWQFSRKKRAILANFTEEMCNFAELNGKTHNFHKLSAIHTILTISIILILIKINQYTWFCLKIDEKNDTFRTVRTVEPKTPEPEPKFKLLAEPVETGTECLKNFRTGTGKFWNRPSTSKKSDFFSDLGFLTILEIDKNRFWCNFDSEKLLQNRRFFDFG